jgi:lipid-A-disaccharide synthase
MSAAESRNGKIRILIVAGESSGDLYAADLVSELKKRMPQVEFDFYGCGGERMQHAGVRTIVDMHRLSVLGPIEVVSHLTHLFSALRLLEKESKINDTQLAILVDFPDFNLRLAKKLSFMSIPVIYLISPQIWAWRSGRVKLIKKLVKRMLVILPFERDFYRRRGVEVEYIGHPLIDRVSITTSKAEFLEQYHLDIAIPTISLLPGSRKKEIRYNLPIILRTAKLLSCNRPVQFVLPLASEMHRILVNKILKEEVETLPLEIVIDNTYNAVGHSDLAVVASGTATLETALLGTPLITVFRISNLTWIIGQYLVQVPFYSLVNLIAGKRIVPELFQSNFCEDTLYHEITKLLDNAAYLERVRIELAEVKKKLGEGGAMAKAAEQVMLALNSPAFLADPKVKF